MRTLLATGLLVLSVQPISAAKPKPRELGRQDSKRIVSLLGIRAGDSVAAIGASSTFLLSELAATVGPFGKVFVVDWDHTAVQGVRHEIETSNLANVTAILGSANDAQLPEQADRVLLVNSYRLIEDRERFFEINQKYLARHSQVAIIDYYRRPMSIGPPVRERVASHRVMRELKKFGYILVDRHNISPYQYFLVYRPRTKRA